MSNNDRGAGGDVVARYLAPGGGNVTVIYVLYLASLIVGVTILIGLVMAYVNRSEANGTWAGSHYTYQIRTFWIGLIYSLISVVLMLIGIGFLLIVAVWIWGLVRCIRGLQWASASQPVPNPRSWFV
jgi:uncharacterized membrane protein